MNLGTYLDRKVDQYGDRAYLLFEDETLSYREFGRRVGALAHGLLRLGFRRGDFIHVLVQNSPETLLSYFAIQKIGAVAGPVNGWWKAAEVEYLLNDSRGRGLIIEPQYLPILDEIRGRTPALEIVVETGPAPRPGHASFHDLVTGGPGERLVCPADPQDPAFIFYTSGTTGNPKGVLLSHRNVLADIRSCQDALDLEEGLRILIFLPLFHVNAMLTASSALDRGGAVVLRRQFSAGEFWAVVERYRVNYFSAVPAVYAILLKSPERDRYDRSSLKFGICGAAPMPVDTFRAFEETFGIPLVEGYGLTEGTCVSTLNPRNGIRKVGSIGLACPGQEVLIVDDAGRELPPNQPGEIVVRGDVVMLGYHNRPAETGETLRDGLLHTGDVGYRDADGYFFIVDRLKDMVIRGGENIYPKEIDAVLAAHPKIRDAACIGVPDPVMGEELKAFVVPADPTLTGAEVQAFCRERLAAFKVPRYVEILAEDLPRNQVGKVLKKVLKQWGLTPRPAPKPPEGGASVADIFATMEGRVNPKGIEGVAANFAYRVTGEGGGEWTVRVRDGRVQVLPGVHSPDVTATIAARDWIDLTLGKLDGMSAFTSGKLKVEGDLGLMSRAPRFFKKYTPPAERGVESRVEELVVLKQRLAVPQRFTTGPLMGKFLQELRDHKRILANKCPVCGRLQTPPREACAVCHVRVEELVEVGPEGIVASFDITYYASPDPLTGQSRETPYCSAFLLLDGCSGSDVFWHELNPAQIDRVRKRARVRPVWEERRKGAITDIRYFEIVD